jgi:acyl transferase domain-containing protein/acyl carrier protein
MKKDSIVRRPLAVIGIACRFPGANSLDQFWELIQNGACSISELPAERLERSLYYSPERGKGAEGKTYSTLGGVVPIPPLDPALCPEPNAYDPAHLTMLEVAAASCRDAGWDPLAMPLRNIGVYIGHARTSPLPADLVFSTHVEECVACLRQTPEFERLPEAQREAIAEDLIRRVRYSRPHFRESAKPFCEAAMAAVLVSQSLGLTGPHMVIDAACASSLIALAIAAGPLQEGSMDAAIVGGASYSNWQSMALFSKAQALSASGSYPFDARADGFISSDGYAAVVLKTLDRALADGDRIHALIRGIGLSSDGRGRSLWAPRKEGQVEAIRRAYSNEVDPSCVQYIEAHGTSTQLGDATELQSLAEVLGPSIPPGRKIPIASVKGNIGHTCECAGLAGLIKAVLAINHKVIPPAVGFARPNPEIDFETLPFFIPTQTMEWPQPDGGLPRRAAIDAFGIGGLNAHVVVDEYLPCPKEAIVAAIKAESGEEGEIAIIGAGAIFPGARTAAAFWEMLASGADPKTIVSAARWDPEIYWNPGEIRPWRSPARVGGFLSDFRLDPLKFRIPPRQMETSDPLQYMVLDAADQALRDAGYDARPFNRRRAAVIVGTMFCNDFMRNLTVALQYPEFERELQRILRERAFSEKSIRNILSAAHKAFHKCKPMLQDETGSFSASTLASRVARTLDLMGGAFSLDAEEASSGAALDSAMALLRSGACDMVLCAGAQRAMDVGIYEEYALRGLITADDAGFLPAEGTGVVLLKRAAEARRDGDPIRAIIKDVRSEIKDGRFTPDSVAGQMGHALGASGIASVLAAISPSAPASSTVRASSLRGLSYGIEIVKKSVETRPRIAFLFAGQGSQYPGMLKELVQESPAAATKLQEIDALMQRLGYQTFSEIAWKSGSGLGTEPWSTQISMLLADVIVLSVLENSGVRPDVVAGHSYGEFPALVAAGSLTLEQAIRATRARADLVKSSPGGSCRLLATSAPREIAQRIVDAAGVPVHVAIQNAPDQTILGGAQSDLDCIIHGMKAEGYHCTLLPMPGAFHTPLFSDIRESFLRALVSIPIVPPRIPMLSGVSLRYVAEPSEIRENLALQPSMFFNFDEMLQRLAKDGTTVFVEVGPQQVLTRLTKRILGKRVVAVACDSPSKPGLEPIMQALIKLKECGAVFSPDRSESRHPVAVSRKKHEIIYFDATHRRREKNLRRSESPSSAVLEAPAPEPLPTTDSDLSSYLIQFVCEQTGYAREVVDLDADLEADLGIDSIKKMQLFSELRDRFDFSGLQPSALSGFSTLRHVLDFLEKNATAIERGGNPAPSDRAEESRGAMKILRLRGGPRQMGEEHGRRQAAAIRDVVRRYGEILGDGITERQDFRAVMESLDAYFSEPGLEELRGMADGAGLPLEILAGLNIALMPELLPGCTHFAARNGNAGTCGMVHAINEDAPLLMTLGQSLLPTALVRHPEGKIPHLTFVLPGQFAGINGINARGVSVSSTLLLDRLKANGVHSGRIHCDLVREILESASTIESAVDILRGARRVGAWGVLIGHRETQDFCYLEYDEDAVALQPSTERIFGANHGLLNPPRDGNESPQHSVDRLNRLEELVMSGGETGCTLEAVQTAMRDCYDPVRKCAAARPTMHTVRRVDNLMSLVMRPGHHEVWVAPGGQTETYQRLDLEELFDARIMRRWVLRAMESPVDASEPVRLNGASLVVGNNPAAKAMKSRLDALGPDGAERRSSPEEALEFVQQSWDSKPARNLFLLSGLDEQPPDILSIYSLCQRWMMRLQASSLLEDAALTAAVSLGGDYGFSGFIGNWESGGVAGLLKAIRREFPGLKVKIVDTLGVEAPDQLASEILREMGPDAPEVEVAYRFGKRFTVRALPQPAAPRSPVPITRGGVWIATGGRSGITAYAARELAEKFDLQIHVFGRGPSADLQYPAVYHPCDVSDSESVRRTLEAIRREAGPVRGVLHGAGVELAARFERKEMDTVRATIASKVQGACNLMESTRQDPLEAFLAFGSVSGRFGGQGQTDYSLANEMLAKRVQKFRLERPECAAVLFHWPAWDKIGMAMRKESRTVLEMAGQRFMPPHEGIEHLFAELSSGAPEGEVLILDKPGAVDTDGSMQPALRVDRPMPLIEGLLEKSTAHCAAEIRLDPVADPFLREHRYRGVSLMPAAIGLEILIEGSGLFNGSFATVLRDVEIHNGWNLNGPRPGTARIIVARDGDIANCRLVTEFRGRKGNLVDPDRILITGNAKPADASSAVTIMERSAAKKMPVQYPKSGPLIHGPSFQCLKELGLDGAGGCGIIVAQNSGTLGGVRRGNWVLPVAELDACLVACGGYVLQKLGALALPRKFGCLRFFRYPVDGERCEVRFLERGREKELVLFDFVLIGADGTAVLQAEEFGLAMAGQGMDR